MTGGLGIMIWHIVYEDMRNLKATVWCDWQLMSVDDGWGMIRLTNFDENDPYKKPQFEKTRGFYCRKNVTNFIKVGYTIIDSNNGNTLAAINPKGDELVVVVVNNNDILQDYSLNIDQFNVLSFKTYRTSGGYNSPENTSEKTISSLTEKGILSCNTLSYTAPAYSITTFVFNVIDIVTNDVKPSNVVKIHPNPNNDKFDIVKPMNEPLDVEIFDIYGRLIVHTVLYHADTELELNKSVSLKKGVYLVKFSNENTLFINKLIIN